MTKLSPTLTVRDLILQNIAAIVGFSTLALSSQFGWPSLTLTLMVAVFFVIPTVIVILDLSMKLPGEGGFYLWTKTALGPGHGFIAAWSYWIGNLVWFPSVLLTIVSVGSTLFTNVDEAIVGQGYWQTLSVCLIILWTAIFVNILGLQKAKWIQNIGGIATWLTILLLIIFGALYYAEFGSIRRFEWNLLTPQLTDWEVWPFFATITFAWVGIELTPIMAGEVHNPQKTIPKALVIAVVIILLIYMAGTSILLISVPNDGLDEILGLIQSFVNMSDKLGVGWIGPISKLLILTSFVGLFAVWLTGNSRVPFVIGIDRYLPKALGNVHPKYFSPYISLLTQGVLISLLLVLSLAGTNVKQAFLILIDMTILLIFIPFIYIFISFFVLQKQNSKDGFNWLIKNKKVGYLCALSGLLMTAASLIFSIIPSGSIENIPIYLLKVVGGALLLLGIGTIFYKQNHQP